MIQYIIFGTTLAFAAAVQPGPLQTFLISQTLEKGWRKTLPAVFAPIISDGPIIFLVLFLLSNLPNGFLNLLQAGGGFFLLYLSFCAYDSFKNIGKQSEKKLSAKDQTLAKAVIVNLLNPNPYLGWSLVMGPLLLKGWKEDPIIGIAFVISFYATIIIGLIITIFLTNAAKNLGSKANKVLMGISSLALACFGFYSLFIGIKNYFFK